MVLILTFSNMIAVISYTTLLLTYLNVRFLYVSNLPFIASQSKHFALDKGYCDLINARQQ